MIPSERAGGVNDKVLNNGILQAAKQSCILVPFILFVVHFETLDGVTIALKHTTNCHACAIGESTQWKSESGRRKVKVSSHFNVCLQSVACCMLEEADEVISSGHRTSVAKRSTQE